MDKSPSIMCVTTPTYESGEGNRNTDSQPVRPDLGSSTVCMSPTQIRSRAAAINQWSSHKSASEGEQEEA